MTPGGALMRAPETDALAVALADPKCNGLAAQLNPALLYLATLKPGSRRSQRGALDTIARHWSGEQADHRTFPWHVLEPQHTTAINSWLADLVDQETYQPATARRFIHALRGVIRHSWRLGYITEEQRTRLVDLPAIKGTSVPKGRSLLSGEITALLAACAADSRPAGARDAALISVLYAGGPRRAEVVALELRDWDPSKSTLTIRRGKGHKARLVPVPGAAPAIADWLAVRGIETGPLFLPINKGGAIGTLAMRSAAIEEILDRRISDANLSKPASPHDLRRTFAGDLLDAGADIAVVQSLMGHASPVTTVKYDRRGEAAKHKAASLLHVPYLGRRAGPSAGEASDSGVSQA